jgi:hypothetical protein
VTDPNPCIGQNVGRRRRFWTTQLEVCGDYTLCGTPCAIPGLEYVDDDTPYVDPGMLPPSSGYRTIKTDEWIHGLILNILNTRSRTDLKCPSPPGTYGHWSESYRDDGLWVGSGLWNAAERFYPRVEDGVKAIGAAVQADMNKLVILGVASSVSVLTKYAGRNRVDIMIETVTLPPSKPLKLSGTYASDTWSWQ